MSVSKDIFNPTEQDERIYLEVIKKCLAVNISMGLRQAQAYEKEVQEIKNYLWENRDAMDRMEKNAVRQSITGTAVTGEAAVRKRDRLLRLKDSPYFGRIDFRADGETIATPAYIGIHAFYDSVQHQLLIHDWRAPLSGLFYDGETGPVTYDTPSGTICGEVALKRQYRIKKGKMEFMLESSLNIRDDVLQVELSRTSDARMQNIVATIQREQNAIIRNEEAHTLVIQGAAGSGKTSVALHRIAFLLYRFMDTIQSDEILILSPNKVFSDYISTVLPELGESYIPEITPEELAAKLLNDKYSLQTAYDQAEILAQSEDLKLQERIQFKASQEMVSLLESFVVHIENTCFTPGDIFSGRFPIPAWFLEERFKAHGRVPVLKRKEEIIRDLVSNISFYYKHDLSASEKAVYAREVGAMFQSLNIRNLYKQIFEWAGRPDLLKYGKGSTYEYNDVFPLVYLKILLEGVRQDQQVKHLIVDEMQDYTPVHYAVLARLYPCRKTILGDEHQSLNPWGRITPERISRLFPNVVMIRLIKSYRSTTEIIDFARSVLPAADIEPVLRHGEAPRVISSGSDREELEKILEIIVTFRKTRYRSLGILIKNQLLSDNLMQQLDDEGVKAIQITSESLITSQGVIVATPHLVKGLEFDQVLIPYCTHKHYHTETDRHLLYISCTRAMHQLDVTYSGEGMLTGFL